MDAINDNRATILFPRRIFLCALFGGGVLVLGTNFNKSQSHIQLETVSSQQPIESSRKTSDQTQLSLKPLKRSIARPWYFKGGTIRPTKVAKRPPLLPEESSKDRITEQLMYIPANYEGYDTPEKVIFSYQQFTDESIANFPKFHECPVNRCRHTYDRNRTNTADAVIFKGAFIDSGESKPSKQIWIMYYMESPYHNDRIAKQDVINWTATYRRDSDLVNPYDQWTYYDPQIRQIAQKQNYAMNKTKKVAWFVSNCNDQNGRLLYARELSIYIPVDIYGRCGPLKCPHASKENCFGMLQSDYKFYLAFENSNCRDYITEKFYVNALSNDILPIVMGAYPEDYKRLTPKGSYIHVDEFDGPASLANYLHKLDKDDDLYNSYFRWKGTGEITKTYFWCRLCALLHAPIKPKHYENLNNWWAGKGICRSGVPKRRRASKNSVDICILHVHTCIYTYFVAHIITIIK